VAAITLRHYANNQEELGWESYAFTIRALADRIDALGQTMVDQCARAFDEGATAMRTELRDPDGPGWPDNPYRSNQ
jgi:hypothetical protein